MATGLSRAERPVKTQTMSSRGSSKWQAAAIKCFLWRKNQWRRREKRSEATRQMGKERGGGVAHAHHQASTCPRLCLSFGIQFKLAFHMTTKTKTTKQTTTLVRRVRVALACRVLGRTKHCTAQHSIELH